MDFLELAKKRYSTRNFLENRPIHRYLLEKIILASSLAPSACHIMPWKYIVVDDKNLIKELQKIAFKTPLINKFTASCSAIIIALSKKNFLVHRFFGFFQDINYNLLDMGASIENLILEATSLGINSCWIGWFNEKNIKKFFSIPFQYKVVSLIALGYEKDEKNKINKIKNLENYTNIVKKDIINFNKFS